MTALPSARAASPSDLSPASGSSQGGIANAWSADASDVGIMDGHICYVSIDDGTQEIARVRLDRDGCLDAARLMAAAPVLRGELTKLRKALDVIDPSRPLQYAEAMDLMRKCADAALAAAQPKEINP